MNKNTQKAAHRQRNKRTSPSKRQTLILSVLLCAVTAGIYAPMLRDDIVDYDDPQYVTKNHHVQQGLNADSIAWSFTTFEQANWHPLTWLSLMADWQIYNGKPWGFKLTDLLLHTLNTLLLFVLLKQITSAPFKSAFVAALFALHPLHVESVAWIAERKDVLSSAFWMATMVIYALYAVRPSALRYLLAVVTFTLGLLAKPMLVTLPFVLLLIDVWPLKRLSGSDNNKMPPRTWPFLVIEKIPFFVLTAASCIITFIAQKHGGAVVKLEAYSLTTRLANSAVAYMTYLGKMLWPTGLTVFYPHPGTRIAITTVVLCSLALAAITIIVIQQRKKRPYLLIGWLWYLGTLVPVIGLVQVGSQAYADRYTYIPLIGPFVMVVWLFGDWLKAKRISSSVIICVTLAVLTPLAAMTVRQLSFWKNTVTLANRSIAARPDAFIGYSMLGIVMTRKGQFDQAVQLLSKSLELKSDHPDDMTNLAFAYMNLKQFDKANDCYEQAVRAGMPLQTMHYKKACTLAGLGRYHDACDEFEKSLKLDPENADAQHKFAVALAQDNQLDRAIEHFQLALKYGENETTPVIYYHMGYAWFLKGRPDKAIPYLQKMLEINPAYQPAQQLLDKIRSQPKPKDKP